MNDYSTLKTRNNLNSNQKMMEQARDTYYRIDAEYAKAVDRNQNLISQSVKLKLERLENEKNLAFQIYQQLATQVETDRVKINEEAAIATVLEPAKIPLQASAPQKTKLILGFAFFSVIIYVLISIYKIVFPGNEPAKENI